MAKLTNAIRRAISSSGQTRYRIAKETGISQSQLSRLMAGTIGLGVERIEKLSDYLGLEIIIRPKRRRKGR